MNYEIKIKVIKRGKVFLQESEFEVFQTVKRLEG